MSTELTVAVAQFTPRWNDKGHNRDAVQTLLRGASAHLVVLPELCTTGYSFLTKEEASAAADTAKETAAFFVPEAQRANAVIVAGFAEREGDEVYNSAIMASPNGSYEVYRKTHLFFREKDCFAPGNTGFVVVKHSAVDCNLGVMICYDWRFPESARTLALMGADVICVPANLVTSVWEIGMKARALENNLFVAVANRCGTERRTLPDGSKQRLTFTGKSVVYNVDGSEMAQATPEGDSIFKVTINVAKSRDKFFNAYNHVLNDRAPHHYKLD